MLEISISENPFANSWVPRLLAAAPDESSSEYITYTFTSADKVVRQLFKLDSKGGNLPLMNNWPLKK